MHIPEEEDASSNKVTRQQRVCRSAGLCGELSCVGIVFKEHRASNEKDGDKARGTERQCERETKKENDREGETSTSVGHEFTWRCV